ncbi:MAG: glycosyltransferase [Anaerolineales bacterium]|nr:glycosyltransferase family 2 protein [Anaerolineae bacterium]PWB68818.1 MAG: glycosyltransferase [Anaerolineales bacterium]
MSPGKSKLKVDLVIPVFNESGVVEQTYAAVCAVIDRLPYRFNIYYVDDGSTDGTPDLIAALAKKDERIILLELARNFGHQAALSAGLDASQGDFVISMDADGQHPPEMIEQMLELLAQGYDIVQAQRIEEEQVLSFKRITSSAFYGLINRISGTQIAPGAADFRGMSRQAVDAVKSMPEYHRFLRGMVSWIGYRSVILPYHEAGRVSGKSKYSLGKMFRLAMDAIFSFSLMPLYIGLSAGGIFFCLAALEMIYVLSFWVKGDTSTLAPGWSSLMFVILIASGMLMILLGFIGIYVGYIFQEVKKRPVYLLKKEGK